MSETPERGWRRVRNSVSLPESHASVRVGAHDPFWRKLIAFSGPGLLVAVGYMDPGNWATDIAGGAKYGYRLLSVILISNLCAMILQHLALKLGIVTRRDLAQACRDHYPAKVNFVLWILCEIAIAACDLAEVIGSAIALNLLFGLPLVWGVLITAVDVMVVLLLQNWGFRALEAVVVTLILTIGGCFAYELVASRPDAVQVMGGLVPTPEIVMDPGMLYIAIGIIGATVMPHNLYLHSSVVQTRAFTRDDHGKGMAIRFATIDSNVSLSAAFFINATILILSAAAFHGTSHQDVADINDAYHLLTPVLGAPLASAAFAIALLASGQNSTITGTLAGQIVMEGFLDLRLRPWLRRLVTRLIAIVPAAIVAAVSGPRGIGELLILSQVILSLQLSFAVVPLVRFTNDREKMGRFVNSSRLKTVAWVVTALILVLNAYLLVVTVAEWLGSLEMYTRILVPLENSEADQTILDHVLDLARLHRAHILFAHVAVGFAARYQDALDLQDSEEIRRARAYLASVKARFEDDGFDTEIVLETGDAASRLVELAESNECDLIAMATHRHGIFQDVLRGSVAHAVRHRTRIPVLMVPSR